jgi:23S rRNA (cytosine1962-C5)-methyltransferase
MSQAPPKAGKLKIRLTPAAERAVHGGHPWVYADRIREINRPGTAGELAIAYDRQDRFMAIGLYDPDSTIALRVLHAGEPVQLNDAWWQEHLAIPLRERAALFDDATTGYRCVNGESDGWPGLVLDRYAGCYVLKLYTAAWFPHLERIAGLIMDQCRPISLVLRLSRNIRVAAETLGLADGQVLRGEAVTGPVQFREHGKVFEADVIRGQKTGFFLDQRENRRLVGEQARGCDVLNVFSHTGGFSVYAAAGGAKSTTDLDISANALAAAKRNFQLNRDLPVVAACGHQTIQADAFAWLAANSRPAYDVVIIDPPSLAKREADKAEALAAYERLAGAAARLLGPGGLLVSASCSAHVRAAEFFQVVREAVCRVPGKFEELRLTGHAPDHPARIPEAEYLKCIYLRKAR